MKKAFFAVLLFCCSGVSVAAVPDGKIEKPFTFNNEVVCLKEIQEQMTPYLKSFEEEGGIKYKYNVKSGLQINRVDSGLNVRVADLDYYWLQERGSMCQPAYMVLNRL